MTHRFLFILGMMAILSCGNWTKSKDTAKTISWDEINDQLKAKGMVYLKDKTITGDWDWRASASHIASTGGVTEYTIEGHLILDNCEIEGRVGYDVKDRSAAHRGYWYGRIKLHQCHVMKTFELKDMEVRGDLNLSESTFHGDLSLVSSTVYGDLNLQKAVIAGEAMLGEMVVNGDCLLFSLECGGMMGMQGSNIRGQLMASVMVCDGYADFSRIRCSGGAFINYSTFKKGFTINNSSFLDRLEILGSNFEQPLAVQKICTLYEPLIAEYKDDMITPELNTQCKS